MSDTLYCPGCNALFPRSGETHVCPRCGVNVELGAARRDEGPDGGETLLMRGEDRFSRSSDDTLAEDVQVGELRLDGRRIHVYECETMLGRGCMGQVYLARHMELHRRCALKVLSPRVEEGDFDYVHRFLQEGRAAAPLTHPNIVTVHAIGESEGLHFLEMEFVAGRSLQSLVDREGPVTPVRATVLAAQIAEGIAAAHRHGVVHRDLKPDNVLLTTQGTPKIADFGLAKRIVGDDRLHGRFLCGTPHYMAPELFAGEPATTASDVYALGICYHLLLTGHVPFRAGSIAALADQASTLPIPNVRDERPEVTLEMAECVAMMLSKTPAARPSDGVEAAQLLQAVAGQVRDIESLLAESFREDDAISWTREGSRYRVEVRLRNGRGQSLFVEPSEHTGAERLLLIYSVCCAADPDFYEEALRINAQLSHGGLSIRDIDGRPMFVMVDTYPRATVDAEEVRRSVLEVAYRADRVEELLTNLDHH